MKNQLRMFNKLVESAEGLEVNFKVGKECELHVKGDFMKMAKVIGQILEAGDIECEEQRNNDLEERKRFLEGELNR